MARIGIGLGVDAHRGDAHLLEGSKIRHAIAPRLAIRTLLNILVPDEDLNWCRIVAVAWVVQLRAVADHHQDIHLGAQFDILAGVGNSIFEGKLSVGSYWDIHEEIDVAGDIPLVHAAIPLLDAFEEALAAGMHVTFG
jgi:hypothetical protein